VVAAEGASDAGDKVNSETLPTKMLCMLIFPSIGDLPLFWDSQVSRSCQLVHMFDCVLLCADLKDSSHFRVGRCIRKHEHVGKTRSDVALGL
jgi:hypothetical protein